MFSYGFIFPITQLLVKDKAGSVVKGVPLRITTAHSLALTSHPDPESKQLILGYEYDIKIALFNRDGREVYPSEVKSDCPTE